MTPPTIHLNGTSKESLLQALCDAYSKVNEAAEAVARTGPHGRDYYPQGDNALKQATTEHVERMNRLRAVAAELEQLAIAID